MIFNPNRLILKAYADAIELQGYKQQAEKIREINKQEKNEEKTTDSAQ